ncbi:MAG: hypothetical protein J5634_02695 [Bacilli bacterium]|nr:hypothetical protein [Bacilli bacterium]
MIKKNDFEVINKIYKPYKYTIKNNVKILYCDDENLVIKPKCKNLNNTYEYLKASNFNNYIPIKDELRSNYDIFPYVEDKKVSVQQKGNDLARLVAIMHAKTSYEKDVDSNIYDKIYYDVLNNCDYLENYYSDIYDKLFLNEYHKPHEILFLHNYSKINNAIGFCKSNLESYFNLISEKKTQRVSLIHNNLEVDHLIKNDDDYLISFDNSRFDTPVIDMVKLYKKEYDNLNFSELLKTYLYHYSYHDDELKLFFILISMPYEIKFTDNNFDNVSKVYKLVNYINKTEELVWPYYSQDEKVE